MSFVTLPSKDTSSTIPVTVDFISQLATGEAVTSVVVTASVFSGVDATPSAIISGAATLSQNSATQVITGGLAGVVYLLAFAATTNNANRLIIYAYLAVINSSPFTAQ